MNREILIAHSGNQERLARLLRSIAANEPGAGISAHRARRGRVAAINAMVGRSCGDVLFLLPEDAEVIGSALTAAVERMRHAHPAGDGVVVIPAEDCGHERLPLGVLAIGRRFAARFGRALLCPDYRDHYADLEVIEYAATTGRLAHSAAPILRHDPWPDAYRPDHHDYMGQTVAARDAQTWKARRAHRLTWGHTNTRLRAQEESEHGQEAPKRRALAAR